ncbi:hypothetical protein [Cytobacillus sp. IB215316]|uniref:hypothetical protein n=1 Tax=Cytobacillus sp. IB215316 TaxID=3097354 RepID=UPI002A0D1E26|nr:hypothetical protein [Cytobacillus sp. IB215316]MDX8361646.1 hypothetical protein [Cytobacillus sp. IB215316]
MNKDFNRKRLMYNNSEDLYFITYNIILLLYHLNCIGENKPFNDYRKLVFLIPIISDEKKTTILLDYYKGNLKPNRNIHREINRLYYDSIENITLIRYVLMILEREEIIKLINVESRTNLYISNIEKSKDIASNLRFKDEKERILKLKKKIRMLSRLNYLTFVDCFFKRNGVAIWENY